MNNNSQSLKSEQRVTIIKTFYYFWAAMLKVQETYYLKTLDCYFWPETLLPFSKELILQALKEHAEFANDEEIRSVVVDQESIHKMEIILWSNFMDIKGWLKFREVEKLDNLRNLQEGDFIKGKEWKLDPNDVIRN